ncbi:hypothetical protein E2C01_093615 [Portunus trituberculatus]|uniref:Uncharacterized protein n=1 Tax=Portunus trituberculatus TaxID=210409 RepID=A0A5B7JUN1_PORTR|nr:hypothetical protein [Portunus trituberculatus]
MSQQEKGRQRGRSGMKTRTEDREEAGSQGATRVQDGLALATLQHESASNSISRTVEDGGRSGLRVEGVVRVEGGG